jgi:lambda repressor-like predicted transcriptional regulator
MTQSQFDLARDSLERRQARIEILARGIDVHALAASFNCSPRTLQNALAGNNRFPRLRWALNRALGKEIFSIPPGLVARYQRRYQHLNPIDS